MSRGEKYVHVYQIDLEEYETSTFYHRDGEIITLASDVKYPWINIRITLVGPSVQGTGRVIREQPSSYSCGQDRILVPSFGILNIDYDEVINTNALASFQAFLDFENIDDYCVCITRKRFTNDIWRIGMMTIHGYGGERFVRNESVERYINRRLGLKAFW